MGVFNTDFCTTEETVSVGCPNVPPIQPKKKLHTNSTCLGENLSAVVACRCHMKGFKVYVGLVYFRFRVY
jgi:hypothetical protein